MLHEAKAKIVKVIIAGSRSIKNGDTVTSAIMESGFQITEVVTGMAAGVDLLGEEWARYNYVSIVRFVPDWDTHGKKAGILRNIEMANYADALIAVWDGESKGTKHMIDYATKRGLKVFVHKT